MSRNASPWNTFEGGKRKLYDSITVEFCDDNDVSGDEDCNAHDKDTNDDMGERSLESRPMSERIKCIQH